MKSMPPIVIVSGDGPAACATALALGRLGMDVTISAREAKSASSPPVVLGESTVALIADFCGDSTVFASAHQLRRRIVCWGTERPEAIDHAAISMRGSILRRDLFSTVVAKLEGPAAIFSPGRSSARPRIYPANRPA